MSTPTGSVSFYDGTTLLSSGTMASSVATYSKSNLAAGTHSITAVYGSDSNFSSVTSSAVSQVVSDLTVGAASGGSTTATVSAGGTATYHRAISPSIGTTLPATVTLAASGGPTGSTITITPQTIAAGAAATNVAVAAQILVASAAVRNSNVWLLGLGLPLMGMFALPFRIEGRRLSPKRMLVALYC